MHCGTEPLRIIRNQSPREDSIGLELTYNFYKLTYFFFWSYKTEERLGSTDKLSALVWAMLSKTNINIS